MEEMKLGINCKIDVLWEEKEIYKSIIQDNDDDSISISVPVKDGQYLTPYVGEVLEIMWYDGNGNVYKFKGKINARNIDNNIPLFVISKPYDIRKVQRRDYVRVKVIQMIEYIKGEIGTENIIESIFSPGILLDLSGGGMKVKIKEKINRGDYLVAMLKYKEIEILTRGKIVRVDKTDDNKYICGVNFDELDNNTREQVIKMVFAIMRKQRELI